MEHLIDIEKEKHPQHHHLGIRFQVLPIGPAMTHVPLQMVCFFDQTKNQVMEGGAADVDQHFNGALKKLRAADHFRGDLFETLLLTPQNKEIPADQILLIGLGDPADFSLERLEAVGKLIIHEALKLNMPMIAFAPSIKDAGISHFPAGEVSVAIATGMVKALQSAQALRESGLLPTLTLKEIIFLAGAKHVKDSQEGLRNYFKSEISRSAL